MLKKWLHVDTVTLCQSVDDWQHALKICALPLLEREIITTNYLQAIFHSHETIGPYYVLAPGVAMPHARPEEGALSLGLSMLVVSDGVNFHSDENDPVFMIVMLAAPDSDSHLEIISELAEFFSNENDRQSVMQADNVEHILSIIDHY